MKATRTSSTYRPQSVPGTPNVRRSDSYISEGFAFKVDDYVGRQDLFLTGSANQFHYDHLTELDNTGYQFDGGVLWKLTSILNGKFDVSRTRAMTSFLDTMSTSLSLQTEQRETMDVTLKVAPEWKLNGTGYSRASDQTQPDAPDLKLSEQSGTMALSYLGLGNFTAGADAGYLSGRYTGALVTVQPMFQLSSYQQTTFDLLATYKAGGRSTFSGSVGYSDRVSPSGLNNTSGVTGNLSFQDQLTPKTSITLVGSRVINSYLTTASSEIDTSAQASVDWRATYKLDVQLSYLFTYRDFPDQPGYGFPRRHISGGHSAVHCAKSKLSAASLARDKSLRQCADPSLQSRGRRT